MCANVNWAEFENKVQHDLNQIKLGKHHLNLKRNLKHQKLENGNVINMELYIKKFRFTANSDIIAHLDSPFRNCPVGYTFKKGGYIGYDELML